MSRLWAITSYYNPAGYVRRQQNYHVFRKHLQVPLAAIELSFNGEFFLKESDADILVQINGADVMWQKERLLNRIIQELPDECDCVAWIDADVVFKSDDWSSQAIEALQTHGLVHLFNHRLNLGRDESLEDVLSGKLAVDEVGLLESSIYLRDIGQDCDEDLSVSNAMIARGTTVGLAWASPRSILERHGLYDVCILGSGDRVITAAAIGRFDFAEQALGMTSPLKEHYYRWAKAYYASVQSRMCHVPGLAIHLWHGELVNRQYAIRHNILSNHGFDPNTDIAVNDQGIHVWASDKPEMHAEVEAYFYSRHEDG